MHISVLCIISVNIAENLYNICKYWTASTKYAFNTMICTWYSVITCQSVANVVVALSANRRTWPMHCRLIRYCLITLMSLITARVVVLVDGNRSTQLHGNKATRLHVFLAYTNTVTRHQSSRIWHRLAATWQRVVGEDIRHVHLTASPRSSSCRSTTGRQFEWILDITTF